MRIFTLVSVLTISSLESLARKLLVIIFLSFHSPSSLQTLPFLCDCLLVFFSFRPTLVKNNQQTLRAKFIHQREREGRGQGRKSLGVGVHDTL